VLRGNESQHASWRTLVPSTAAVKA